MRTVLAVDGGNSKTDVALIAEDGTVLATARGAAFLPQSVGVPAAIDALHAAVRQALPHAVSPYADHIAAYVAGADLPVEEDRLTAELLSRGYGRGVVVGNDTFALLRAGTEATWGAAVVCGAGINAVAVAPDGRVARFPALGRISGDWGGGSGLAEEALWHAVRAEDGRGPATALTEVVRGVFGTRTVEEVVIALHFEELPTERLHELVAPLLAAAPGDAVARSVVERQAEEIELLGTVAMRRVDLLDAPCEVVLGGGVLTARDPLLTMLVEQRYAASAPLARLVIPDLPPIAGAALLGLDRLGATPDAHERVRDHYAGNAGRPRPFPEGAAAYTEGGR
ncbi:N-acetylglucosamine kinase [Acrocarpospora catenulata]|uniref:N-acetylglucosamine kinase n=1 Tax=Acrocarpospora catenulata TaxID=2836182 RepID=UPI001BD93A13|nr:BadF/BadG/BcrA/BcrD ATPase family protein [Acrocarpospora catenulata]